MQIYPPIILGFFRQKWERFVSIERMQKVGLSPRIKKWERRAVCIVYMPETNE